MIRQENNSPIFLEAKVIEYFAELALKYFTVLPNRSCTKLFKSRVTSIQQSLIENVINWTFHKIFSMNVILLLYFIQTVRLHSFTNAFNILVIIM